MSLQKDKGNSHERDTAKFLTGLFGYHFNRNIAGSGAYVGGINSFRKNILSESQLQFCRGDIAVPPEMPNMVVECKFYKDFPFHHLLLNKDIPIMNKWIEQQKDVIDDNSFWFIVWKINRCGTFVTIPLSKVSFIDDKLKNHTIYLYKGEKFLVTEFEEFFTTYKENIEKLSK